MEKIMERVSAAIDVFTMRSPVKISYGIFLGVGFDSILRLFFSVIAMPVPYESVVSGWNFMAIGIFLVFLSDIVRAVRSQSEFSDEIEDALTLVKRMKKEGVPAGSIRNMKEVFEMEQAKNMILEETLEDGSETKRVKTVAFTVS